MPRRSRSRMAASEEQAGPMVQMILARRRTGLAGRCGADGGASAFGLRSMRFFLLAFNSLLDQEPSTFVEKRSFATSPPVPPQTRGSPTLPAETLPATSLRFDRGQFFSQHGSGEQQGVELCAYQHYQGNQVHP